MILLRNVLDFMEVGNDTLIEKPIYLADDEAKQLNKQVSKTKL